MYVCVCMAVSETSVREVIEGGAVSREAVTLACGAGGDCGACHGMILSMIEDHVEESGAVVCCPAGRDVPEQLVSERSLVRTRAA